jgi:hypothetical protein
LYDDFRVYALDVPKQRHSNKDRPKKNCRSGKLPNFRFAMHFFSERCLSRCYSSNAADSTNIELTPQAGRNGSVAAVRDQRLSGSPIFNRPQPSGESAGLTHSLADIFLGDIGIDCAWGQHWIR